MPHWPVKMVIKRWLMSVVACISCFLPPPPPLKFLVLLHYDAIRMVCKTMPPWPVKIVIKRWLMNVVACISCILPPPPPL